MPSVSRRSGDIRSLELLGPEAGKLRADKKIPMPASVSVTWADGQSDVYKLERFQFGAVRDVLSTPDALLVFKLQGGKW